MFDSGVNPSGIARIDLEIGPYENRIHGSYISIVKRLHFTFNDGFSTSNNIYHGAPCHGKNGFSNTKLFYELRAHDSVKKITIWADDFCMNAIQFHTTAGVISPLYGIPTQKAIQRKPAEILIMPNEAILGVFGRFGGILDKVGFTKGVIGPEIMKEVGESEGDDDDEGWSVPTCVVPFFAAQANTSADVEGLSEQGVKFQDAFTLGKELGSGAFSVVKEGTIKNRGTFAIRIVTKSKLTEEDALALQDEITVLKELKHDNIIRLYDVYDEKSFCYLVTEKMMGGELFDRIVQKSYYNEKEARDICLVLFKALKYCDDHQVAHRDLKPENLLLLSNGSDLDIKLADFGFAKKCPGPGTLRTQCGTPGYVAPEILEGVKYDTQADMWSIGVIVYILLGGYPPFIEQNQRELFRKIRKAQYKFHDDYWGQVSDEAKNLIRSLLTADPRARKTASQVIRSDKWVNAGADVLEEVDLGVNLVAMKKFNAKRKFKAALKTVVTQKLTSLGNNFKQDLLDM